LLPRLKGRDFLFVARRSLIPVGFLQWAVKSRNVEAARVFLLMKVEHGRKPDVSLYKPEAVQRLISLNLLGYDPATGKHHQRSWEEVYRVIGITSSTCVYLTKKILIKYSLQDIAYSACLQYHFRLQEDGGPISGKPRGGQRAVVHLHPSIHNGGIAHSIMAGFFGRSIHWSQLRRKSCQARGLLRFTPRKHKASEFPEGVEVPDTDVPYRSFDITSSVKIRVRFVFHIPVWLRKLLPKRRFDAKEGVYIYG